MSEAREPDSDDSSYNEDDNEEDNSHSYSSGGLNNEIIIQTLTSYVTEDSTNSEPEDLASYKAKVKVLLEQLVFKLEEDVGYQKNLELQRDELESELNERDDLIKKLSSQLSDTVDDCHVESDALADQFEAKLDYERSKRAKLEKALIRLQMQNAKLESEVRILKYKKIYPNVSAGAGAAPTDGLDDGRGSREVIAELQTRVDELNAELTKAKEAADRAKRAREIEMRAVLSLANSFRDVVARVSKSPESQRKHHREEHHQQQQQQQQQQQHHHPAATATKICNDDNESDIVAANSESRTNDINKNIHDDDVDDDGDEVVVEEDVEHVDRGEEYDDDDEEEGHDDENSDEDSIAK